MANNFKLKMGGVAYDLTSVTEADLARMQAAINLGEQNAANIAQLSTALAQSNSLQHVIAAKDLGAEGATIDGLTPGALYDCYYNAAGRYLTYNKSTGKFTDDGAEDGDSADIVPATIKVFPAISATTVAAPRIYQMTSNFDGFVKTTGAQNIGGLKTFETTPRSTAEQDAATIADNELVKGSTLKSVESRTTAAEGKITALETANSSKLSAKVVASKPDDEDLEEGVITLYPAADRLTSGSSDDDGGDDNTDNTNGGEG
ncbi:MAG: hypothetical protein IJ228_01750 [Succinivibrio sp.]|nr:hypothetical protein [Succinivibrio sp.]